MFNKMMKDSFDGTLHTMIDSSVTLDPGAGQFARYGGVKSTLDSCSYLNCYFSNILKTVGSGPG